MLQTIQRKLLGLRVIACYTSPVEDGEKDENGHVKEEECEVEGVIEAAWQYKSEIWVAVVPKSGYIITGPLYDCYIEDDDDEEEKPEEIPELSVDGVGPSPGEDGRY